MPNETSPSETSTWSPEERSAEALAFLKDLYETVQRDWYIEFDFLVYQPTLENPDAKLMTGSFFTIEQVFSEWDGIFSELEKENRTRVANIHHSVAPRFERPKKGLGKNVHVSHLPCAWVDVDFHGNESGVRKLFNDNVDGLRQLSLGPSIIVESGHGLHGYWLFNKPYPVAVARAIVCGLQDYFKIADAVNDARRVLRLPGFMNLKDPKHPAWCRIVERTGVRYAIDAFKDFALDPGKSDEEKEVEKVKAETPRIVSRDPKIEEIKDGVAEGEGPYGGRNASATALAGHYCARGLGKRGIVLTMLEWNQKNKPPLDEEEVKDIIERIWVKHQVQLAEQGKPEKPKSLKEQAREKRLGQPWCDEEGNFNSAIMAQWFVREYQFLSTPIAENGEGVMLYKYENGVYLPIGAHFIRQEASRHLGGLATIERIVEVLRMVTEYSKLDYAQINQKATEFVNVKNGMLEWRTGTLHKHDPAYKSLIQIDTEYNPGAKSPDLDTFFEQIFPPDCIPLVEEFIGYLLVPMTSLEKCFVAVGSGGNGKSTFLKILGTLLGERNICALSLHQIQEDKYAAAGLLGKLANIYHDLDPQVLRAAGKFKSIVSGDPVSAERKYKDHYAFRPFARLVFSANEFPRSMDKSEAFFDRLIFVEFPKKFRATEGQVLDYDQVLLKKPQFLQALFNRALMGLQRLMKAGRFTSSETSSKAIEAYKRECSSQLDFILEHCMLSKNDNDKISRSEIYHSYQGWCIDQGVKAVGAKNFAKAVREFGAVEGKVEGTRYWCRIYWTGGRAPKTSQLEISEFSAEKSTEEQGEDF